jgi:hypothetical protein
VKAKSALCQIVIRNPVEPVGYEVAVIRRISRNYGVNQVVKALAL